LHHPLAEADIFGYVPKAGIAGADPKVAPGWFELANRDTLFLDEVHRLTPAAQDKFLRVLQDKPVWGIGAKSPVQVEVNVVAATDEDLEGACMRTASASHSPLASELRSRFRRFGSGPRTFPLLAYFFVDKYAKMLGSGPEPFPVEVCIYCGIILG
jgi:predicted ATP-dependent protease